MPSRSLVNSAHDRSPAPRLRCLDNGLPPTAPPPACGWQNAVLPALALLLVLSMLAALTIGRYPLGRGEILAFLLDCLGLVRLPPERFAMLENVIVAIRLPRILSAVLVGAALSSSGAAFQSVFRNPLVSPGLLGALSGASFGAALGMLLSGHWILVQSLAFVFGLLAVATGLAIGLAFGGASILMLVLGGMISSSLFAALLSIVKYVADPINQLPSIVYWLMGSLGMCDLDQLLWLAGPMLAGIVLLSGMGRALDALAMGDDEARSLGLPVMRLRFTVIATATLISAMTVSIAGIVGWIGLIVPHIVRLLLGPANARLLPASALFGASFLLAADCLARSAWTVEIPIGIVTELLGIPVFLMVLRGARRGWN